ncbi:uncharacterized protein [Spinacia oleracea]|uniref:Protein FAR1-RELATED SEQUENCE n=1 Tax=Spinacia oleracea TaxID=3562 RepID=A0ABM3QYL0_SPIOL|nr:uncharacterized protein LOC130463381 [Spinacia oleracea]
MRFESTVESQRHSQSMSDNDNFSLIPELKTNRDLERHASQVYPFTNFYKFQEQLWLACMDCEVEDKKETKEGLVITIANHSRKNGKMREVVYNPTSHVAHYSCKMFQWTKMEARKSIFNVPSNLLEGCSKIDNEDKLIPNNWLELLNNMNLEGCSVAGGMLSMVSVLALADGGGGIADVDVVLVLLMLMWCC